MRQLEYLRLDRLNADERNPKAHDVETLRASVYRLGFVEPVVIDERTGKLVSGHGRVETLIAAHAAGLERPEGLDADDDGMWAIPVVRGWSSANDVEAEAALVALNQGDKAGWVPDKLATILSDLRASEAGLSGVGYDGAQLDKLLAELQPVESSAESQSVPQSWMIVVECDSEQQQLEWIGKLNEAGLSVRALVS